MVCYALLAIRLDDMSCHMSQVMPYVIPLQHMAYVIPLQHMALQHMPYVIPLQHHYVLLAIRLDTTRYAYLHHYPYLRVDNKGHAYMRNLWCGACIFMHLYVCALKSGALAWGGGGSCASTTPPCMHPLTSHILTQ